MDREDVHRMIEMMIAETLEEVARDVGNGVSVAEALSDRAHWLRMA